MQYRFERTIREPASVSGIGFLTGADIGLRFLPAPAGHGIVFRRTDRAGAPAIPARIEYAPRRRRRTALERDGISVEMVEHALAALAGLRIDNCLVEVDGPEIPGCDGSALAFAAALSAAGIDEQPRRRPCLVLDSPFRAACDDGTSEISANPRQSPGLLIDYALDYGPHSAVGAQRLQIEITPESFLGELAPARTFVLQSEVAALRAEGYGSRTTARDLLVFGSEGVIDNELRFRDECVRHKILDCVGDFALLGCDIHGRFHARRSGHQLNRAVVRGLNEFRSHQRRKAA